MVEAVWVCVYLYEYGNYSALCHKCLTATKKRTTMTEQQWQRIIRSDQIRQLESRISYRCLVFGDGYGWMWYGCEYAEQHIVHRINQYLHLHTEKRTIDPCYLWYDDEHEERRWRQRQVCKWNSIWSFVLLVSVSLDNVPAACCYHVPCWVFYLYTLTYARSSVREVRLGWMGFYVVLFIYWIYMYMYLYM